MEQAPAIGLLIVLALFTANLPFVSQRRLLVLPWVSTSEQPRSWWRQAGLSLVFFGLVAAWYWLVQLVIADALYAEGGLVVLGRLAGVGLAAFVVLALPGILAVNTAKKPFLQHLLEVMLLYFMVGSVGLALESGMGNPFPKGWEFYVITLSLYLVLGYPGFVYRYLLRHR